MKIKEKKWDKIVVANYFAQSGGRPSLQEQVTLQDKLEEYGTNTLMVATTMGYIQKKNYLLSYIRSEEIDEFLQFVETAKLSKISPEIFESFTEELRVKHS